MSRTFEKLNADIENVIKGLDITEMRNLYKNRIFNANGAETGHLRLAEQMKAKTKYIEALENTIKNSNQNLSNILTRLEI